MIQIAVFLVIMFAVIGVILSFLILFDDPYGLLHSIWGYKLITIDCPKCGKYYGYKKNPWNYCPSCGSKIKVEE